MLRPRRNWTRGVAAQHASLSRWRSPVRIRSGPPSSAFPYAPSARPDGAFLCPGRSGARAVGRPGRPIQPTSVTLRRVTRRPIPIAAGLVLVALVAVLAAMQLGFVGGSAHAVRVGRRPPRATARPRASATAPGGTQPPDDDASPDPGASATARDPGRARRDRGRADRAGHQLPLDRDCRHVPRTSPRSSPAPATRTTRLALVEGEAPAILAALGRGRRRPRPSRPVRRRADPRRGPRQEPQAARLRPRRRRRPGCPGADLERQGAVRGRSGQGPRRLAAERPAPGAGPGRRPTTRRRPGPCSPAATSCSTAAST